MAKPSVMKLALTSVLTEVSVYSSLMGLHFSDVKRTVDALMATLLSHRVAMGSFVG